MHLFSTISARSGQVLKPALCALLFSVCLAGCQQTAQQSEPVGPISWSALQEQLQQVHSVSVAGRLSMTGSARFSANFSAQCEGDKSTLVLTSPFGSEIARLSVVPGHASLIYDSHTYEAASATELFRQQFNLAIPADSLRQVILGLPGSRAIISPDGQVETSLVDGFAVNYERFGFFNQLPVPVQYSIVQGNNQLQVRVNEVRTLE